MTKYKYIPGWGQTHWPLPSCCSSYLKQLFLLWSTSCYAFCIFMLFVGEFTIQKNLQVLKCCMVFLSARRLHVPCTEKICVLNKLHSVKSYSAGHFEYNVIEPPIYILKGVFKQKNTNIVYWSVDENVWTSGFHELNSAFLLGAIVQYSAFLVFVTTCRSNYLNNKNQL